jgi:hypothetical protein
VLPITTDTVTVVHAPVVSDLYNNRVRDWTAATRTAVRGVVDSAVTTEATDGKDQTDTLHRIYLPEDTAVTAQDRLEWDSVVLEVTGEPIIRRGATPALNHIELLGRLVSG